MGAYAFRSSLIDVVISITLDHKEKQTHYKHSISTMKLLVNGTLTVHKIAVLERTPYMYMAHSTEMATMFKVKMKLYNNLDG